MSEFKPKDVMSESETRKAVLKQARRFLGPEAERQVRMHFIKYDNLLKQTKNESEKKHIKVIALAELYKLMGFYNGLTVNGQEIIPAESTASAKPDKKLSVEKDTTTNK